MNFFGARGLVILVSPLAFFGCGTTDLWFYSCPNPDHGHLGPDQQPDPCHYKDPPDAGAGASATCAPGDCRHWKYPFGDLLQVWFGPAEERPMCPDGVDAFTGMSDLVPSKACKSCVCQAPTGSCELPTEFTASSAGCNLSGGLTSSFNAPAGWDGSCDRTTQVPAGAAASLSIAPMKIKEDGCEAGPPIPSFKPEHVPSKPNFLAIGCHADAWFQCGDDLSACVPNDTPLLPGFRPCVVASSDHETCTGMIFSEPHRGYYRNIQENTTCGDCTCGPPTGSMCTATVSIDKDLACSDLVGEISISSAKPACVDFSPAGLALGSKSATHPTYIPGMCEPGGGQPTGEPDVLIDPVTICCRP